MEKFFRSRGIGFYTDGKDISAVKHKKYYEADYTLLPKIKGLEVVNTNVLSFFEYAEDLSGNVSALNYHVDLTGDYNCIYSGLDIGDTELLISLPKIIGHSFKVYTVGYRIKNMTINGQSFYFYPTIYRTEKNKFGIQGITDTDIINESISRFCSYVGCSTIIDNQIQEYSALVGKLKGLCITYTCGCEPEFKIYGRVESGVISTFLAYKIGLSYTPYTTYGEVALTSIRFSKAEIKGYNIYFLS